VPHRLVDPKDWDRQTTAEQIRERSIQGVEDGTVLLFHEWRQETVDQIPAIIAALREQGCVFLTFSELEASLREKPPASAPDTALQARFAGAAEESAE
jgi:peptidoglycan/xylan/chitin deacetylase (PgdA/CDA1 family)